MNKREDFSENLSDSSPFGAEPAGQETGSISAGGVKTPQDELKAGKPGGPAELQENAPGASAKKPEQAGNSGAQPDTADAPGSDGQGEAAQASEMPLTSEEKIAELGARLAEANDNYLRKAADFENFRKRMNQEKASAIEYANQALLLDLLTVIDDFERAIKAAETQREAAGTDSAQIAAGYNSLYDGISMIEKKLVSQLENKWGLKRFDSAGEPFDPNRHEAIMMEKSAELEEPVVAEDFIKGYTLKDRVIRPAKVKVVMPDKKT
ncbi:MAG: nucleotide exchange factor GrpE [Spirochaetaceae bacterium]|nr:nucleotide exchange factor GrpE [Spirochaetaceae bacterium]